MRSEQRHEDTARLTYGASGIDGGQVHISLNGKGSAQLEG
jgi:hypothetical protein